MSKYRVWYYKTDKDGHTGHYIKDVESTDAENAKTSVRYKLTENKDPGEFFPIIHIDKARKLD